MEANNKFEGWAVVELFGHSREAGFVSTEYFGTGALFRVEVPALEEREVTLDRPEWVGNTFCGIGSKVRREAIEGRTRFIGPSAIYAINPCSVSACMVAIEAMASRKIKVIQLVEPKQLTESGYEEDYDDGEDNRLDAERSA